MNEGRGSAGNVIAALASFFIPGLGQLIQGRIVSAIVFFVVVAVSWALWWLLIPMGIAVVAHIWAIIDAAVWKPRLG